MIFQQNEIIILTANQKWVHSSSGRARRSQRRGSEFDPRWIHQCPFQINGRGFVLHFKKQFFIIVVAMVVSIILLALGAVASAVFIASKVINYSFITIILKGVASLFFVALGTYLFITIPGHLLFKLFTLLGLIFGFLGDVFLGFKYITTKAKNGWILAGMFTFVTGHIFYILALFFEYYLTGHILFIILPFITAICISMLYLFVFKKVGLNFGKILPFGAFYLLCLSSMVVTAFYMFILNGFLIVTLAMFFVGAVFFAASDTMLTGAYFKPGKRSKSYMAIYSVLYYLAQFIIAFSIFFLI